MKISHQVDIFWGIVPFYMGQKWVKISQIEAIRLTPPTPFNKKNLMRGHIISPSIEHTLAAKLPPALWCLVVRHQAPLHSMLPLASEDVLHFSTPEKNQLLRCGISISTYLIVLKFIEVLTAEVSPLSLGQTSKNSFWPRRSDVPPTLNYFCPSTV